MDTPELLTAIARDGRAFRDAAASVPLDSIVASSPGRTVADLIFHLAGVHHFWSSVVEQRSVTGADVQELMRPRDAELLGVYDDAFARLVTVFAAADPGTEVWTWSAQHDVAFVIRRMAHETAVHRWDAEHAAGRAAAIDGELASDGIDEFLEHFLGDDIEGAEPVGGSVHIHCGDVAGEWTIRPTSQGYDVTREHAKGDCALRGEAGNLLLALWRRVGLDAVDVVGDADVARRFVAITNLD